MYVEYTGAVLNDAAHFNTVHFNPGSCSTLLLSADNLVSGCLIIPLLLLLTDLDNCYFTNI
jgi:hypothetical protein